MKYLKKRSSKRFSPLMIAISVALILCMTVGGTIAYLAAQSESVVNTFTPSEVKIEIGEDFNNGYTVKKDVVVKNTGDTDAYVKAMVVINWQNDQGQVIPAAAGDYKIDMGDDKWSDGEVPGIYYYDDILPARESDSEPYPATLNLIDKVEVLKDAPQEGYVLHVEVIASAIQARPAAAKADWQ